MRLARKHVAWYSRGLPGSAEFRQRINIAETAEDALALIDSFYRPLIESGVTAAQEAFTRGRAAGGMSALLKPMPAPVPPAAPDPLAVLGALPMPVVVLDAEVRASRFANPAAEQFFGRVRRVASRSCGWRICCQRTGGSSPCWRRVRLQDAPVSGPRPDAGKPAPRSAPACPPTARPFPICRVGVVLVLQDASTARSWTGS